MKENVPEVLNDLLDIIEQLAEIVSETNPGANYGLIEFLIRRADGQISGMLKSTVSNGDRA
jgi:hypothetical protein